MDHQAFSLNNLSSAEKGIAPANPAEEQKASVAAGVPLQATEGVIAAPRSDLSTQDQYLVFWDSEDDPANPQNWSNSRKWTTIVIVAGIAFVPSVLFEELLVRFWTRECADHFSIVPSHPPLLLPLFHYMWRILAVPTSSLRPSLSPFTCSALR